MKKDYMAWRQATRLRHSAMNVVFAGAALASVCIAGEVRAQNFPAPTEAQHISVVAGTLTKGLNDLARQTGLQILYDSALASQRSTPGLSGTMSPHEALDLLLAGTGIEARFAGVNQVVLERGSDDRATMEDGGALMLGTITIYGNRSATTLGSTDASVGVVGSEQIRNGQIRSFRDSFRRLGNVMDGDWTDNGFIIRGVNSEGLVPGGAPLASLYVDGVQQTSHGTRRGARTLWDVEQVEVYRGPQSTLSGRAAMAGALYIKTKDPVFDKEAEVSGTAGSNGLRGSAFMLNTPLVDDQVALRFSGVFEKSENDIKYPTFSGFKHLDDFTTDTTYQIRAKLLIEPSDLPSTRALLSYSFSHDDPYVRDIGGPGLGFDFDDKRGDFTIPAYVEHRPTDVHNLGLEITHDLTNALRFTSMTAFSYSDTQRKSPNYRSPGEVNTYHGYYRDHLASQEFRFNYEDERLSWVAGLYAAYEHEDNYYDRTIYDFRNQVQRNDTSSENYAVFGEATYEVAPTFRVTLGGRLDYTRQDISQYLERTEPLGGVTTVRTDYSTDFDEWNFVPKIAIAKDFGRSHTAGLSFSTGFRTGGASYDTLSQSAYTYDPERARTMELFYKGSFLEDRLTLNANLFHTRFEDQQVQMQLDPADLLSRKIVNAASSESWGFEIEPTYRPNEQFDAFLSIGYVNTEFKDFEDASYGDLSGMSFPEAPDWSVGMGANYRFKDGFYVGADAKYTSDYLARLGSLPHDYIDSRWLVNLQAGYRTERWELNAFVENALDETYFVYNDNDTAATLGEGRRFGVNLSARF
ncbi:TonB-dependent receptor [Yangia mangrovi]|uniref:TonB-dependent receptor n=1 Tax=Alloyangia mangrovi TaxID=1779329 RepID=A0A2A3K0Z6_9RHOB|nr:TonB-dependent receptor [Alloyangia mangrovi]MCT4372240.1 TonB-dependent receptor [Alloyangia mangrovi]